MIRNLLNLLFPALLTIAPWGIGAAELKPFRAEYIAEFGGLPIKAKGTRVLEKVANNRYRLSSSADSFLVRVTEYSEFTVSGDHLIPQHYQYERKGIGRNKFEASSFDWETRLVSHEETTSALSPDTQDKLSYQYQLRMDVAAAISSGNTDTTLAYIVADEEKRKEYVFRISGEEILPTPIGDLRTIRVDRVRQDRDRSTTMWLSADYDYVLVRLRIEEGDRGFELNLNAFEELTESGTDTEAELRS